MNEEKKRPEQETKAPAQINITPGEPTAPAAEEPTIAEESPAAKAPQTEKAGQTGRHPLPTHQQHQLFQRATFRVAFRIPDE